MDTRRWVRIVRAMRYLTEQEKADAVWLGFQPFVRWGFTQDDAPRPHIGGHPALGLLAQIALGNADTSYIPDAWTPAEIRAEQERYHAELEARRRQ